MRINMKPEEAKDILSDMRDQHLCFIESSENKDEWQKKYLKSLMQSTTFATVIFCEERITADG